MREYLLIYGVRYLPPVLPVSFFFQHFLQDTEGYERWSNPTQTLYVLSKRI